MSEPKVATIVTPEAAASLLGLHDSGLDTKVESLARTVGLGLNRKAPPELTPQEFVERSNSALSILERGLATSSAHELAGLSSEEYEEIRRAVPELARVAFPEGFAKEVERQVTGEVKESEVAKEPEEPKEQPLNVAAEEGEDTSEGLSAEGKITRKITKIDRFIELVLDGAQDFITGMDWAHFDLDQAKVIESFNTAAIPAVLSEKGIQGVDIFPENHGRGLGGGYVAGTLSKMTAEIVGKNGSYFVGMTQETISPELATFIKDVLSIRGVEAIAEHQGLNPSEVMPHVFKAKGYGPKLQQLVKRRREFIETHSSKK